MKKPRRPKGGVKTLKSGSVWSKEELEEVFKLYSKNPRLTTSRPDIQALSKVLGRAPRAIEAQMQMFRALEKGD
jgi:hypothetical protein